MTTIFKASLRACFCFIAIFNYQLSFLRRSINFRGFCMKCSVLLLAVTVFSCRSSNSGKPQTIGDWVFQAQKSAFMDKYGKIPRDEIIQQASSPRLYGELKQYYKHALIELKAATDKDCAKLVVAIVTIETGKYATPANSYGIPFIMVTADNMGLDFYDIADSIAQQDVPELTQTTEEGAWSKKGAIYLADQLDAIIKHYDTVRSSKTFPPGKKPATFGDLQPNQDEMMYDYGDAPYHLKVNAQGLRMDKDVTFPKRKQTILILGDAEVFSPMLNNEDISTAILQRRHPDKVIINAGVSHYSMDDYETLYKDKARYTEPDLVIVVTNGGDILDQYFSYRNKYSRLNRIYEPSEAEKQFYEQFYGKK